MSQAGHRLGQCGSAGVRAELIEPLDVKRPAIRDRGGYDRNTAPEYFGLMGVAHGPLRRRHSGKGRAVPERLPVDPYFVMRALSVAKGSGVYALRVANRELSRQGEKVCSPCSGCKIPAA